MERTMVSGSEDWTMYRAMTQGSAYGCVIVTAGQWRVLGRMFLRMIHDWEAAGLLSSNEVLVQIRRNVFYCYCLGLSFMGVR